MERIGHTQDSFAGEGNSTLKGRVSLALRFVLSLFRHVCALGFVSAAAGCAIWTGSVVRYHVIDYPTPQKPAESSIPDKLMVYRFLLTDAVDVYHLVVTSADDKERTITLQRWEFDPSDMVTELIQRDLDASGLFEKTVDQWSSARYRYALEGTIKKLEGVVKDGKAAAVLHVDVTLKDFESPIGARKSIMAKDYVIEEPSVDPKPVSIVRAVNLAVRKLSEQIRNDIAATLTKEADGGNDADSHDDKTMPVRVSSSTRR
ncbi:MAG: ABC-type transport auxiliary lipoprotein family protein [Desulfomonilaceae bacterium]|nr:ABC-type transport auxiliary lipoprotein family protein [Desulfomonilaceae bacterium]